MPILSADALPPSVKSTRFVAFWRALDSELRRLRCLHATAGETLEAFRRGKPPEEAARSLAWRRLLA